MIINFILPCYGNEPIGGLKIIYEYSNRLIQKNYEVNIYYPTTIAKPKSKVKLIVNYLRYLKCKFRNNYLPDSWFELNEKINSYLVPYIGNRFVLNGNFVFATSWETAAPVFDLEIHKGNKFYFIQSYEIWSGEKKDVDGTWIMPFKRIVISRWLLSKANELGVVANYIPNAINHDQFYIVNDIKKRDNYSLLMLFHSAKVKGTIYALETIINLKQQIKDLKLTLFSVQNRPLNLEAWIDFITLPTIDELRTMYNNNAIFISPSFIEGFPLPPAEAMNCGCAIIASDIGGHREYCIDNVTALLFEPGNKTDLASKIIKLTSDNRKRVEIAFTGNESIKQYSWDKSLEKFDQLLKNNQTK